MNWKPAVSKEEVVIHPWAGGREIVDGNRWFFLDGDLPLKMGWHKFTVNGRKARWLASSKQPKIDAPVSGYLVAGRIITNSAAEAKELIYSAEPVFLLPKLADYTSVSCHRYKDGRLIYCGTTDDVFNTDPVKAWLESEKAREQLDQEAAKKRKEVEYLKFALEDKLDEALNYVGAKLIGYYPGILPFEEVVQFKYLQRYFECTVQRETLRVLDPGVQLGNRKSGFLVLEDLPPLIATNLDKGMFTVTRHVEITNE
jgi:hypothetical protein